MRQAPITYTEVLAPAIYSGIESALSVGLQDDTDFMGRANALATSTLKLLDAVDWDSSGLPPRNTMLEGERITMQPKAFAQHLTVEAFQDAIVLMNLCIGSTETKVSPTRRLARAILGDKPQATSEVGQVDMLAALTDSKQTLLNRVLGLTDHTKYLLFAAAKRPPLTKVFLGFRQNGPAIKLVGADGDTPKFTWGDQFERWIKENTDPTRGCPARNFVIDTNRGKQPVTHYLWDQLAALRYPEQAREPVAQALGVLALTPQSL